MESRELFGVSEEESGGRGQMGTGRMLPHPSCDVERRESRGGGFPPRVGVAAFTPAYRQTQGAGPPVAVSVFWLRDGPVSCWWAAELEFKLRIPNSEHMEEKPQLREKS